MKKVRVLQIMEPIEGGTLSHLRQIVRLLDREKFSVSVIGSPLRNETSGAELEAMRPMLDELHIVPMVRNVSPLRDASCFARIREILKSGSYDVVHTHSSKAGFLGRFAAKTTGIPLVVHTPHVFPFSQNVSPSSRRLYRQLESIASSWCDAMILLTEFQRQLAVSEIACDPAKLRVIPNGVDGEELKGGKSRNDARRDLGLTGVTIAVLSAGRFFPQKGFPHLIRAAARVRKKNPNVVFLLAGDGPERKSLESLAAGQGLGNGFRFLGHVPEMPSLYRAADIVAIPSLWEGMPYVLLEALYFGKPVVVSNVCGTDEIIADDGAGLLVPPGSEDALAEAIEKLAESPDMRERLGKTGLEISAGYDAKMSVREIEKLYLKGLV
ncbi:MAG TPA: glycosyltransferase family 4 protein [Candidatus Brocadiia bacterium]|nr:glycosyltransferase family 4 protein [Candidatus Brocadiia bacterium]